MSVTVSLVELVGGEGTTRHPGKGLKVFGRDAFLSAIGEEGCVSLGEIVVAGGLTDVSDDDVGIAERCE